MKRIALAVPTLAIAFVLGACHDAVPPSAPNAGIRPSLDVAGDGGAALVPGSDVQQVEVTGGSDFTCVGTVTGTFDNIVVPPGGFCIVMNAVVRGNIKALQDAVLGVFDSQVGGSINGDKADVLQTRNILVGGNIEMAEGGPHPVFAEVAICGATLPNGNIKIIKMTGFVTMDPAFFCGVPNQVPKGSAQAEDNFIAGPGRILSIRFNSIGQNLQVYKNRGPNMKTVQFNTVGESVQCFENEAPFVGGPNTAPKAQGQCF